MKLAYVCTNFNNSDLTVAAVNSLATNVGHELRCIVVDNASRPAEQDKLRRLADARPDVDVFFNERNVGYFGGLNAGLACLRRSLPSFEHAVVGNNDLEFHGSFVDSVAHNLHLFERYPVVSPSIVTVDGEHQNPHVIRGISPLRERVYDLYHANYHLALLIRWLARQSRGRLRRGDEDEHAHGQEIVQGHGSCYLFGPRFFVEFEQLWSPTFLFGEEFFLSKQLADKGYKVYYEPSISLVHVSHATVSHLPSRRQWELSRDAHRIYRQYNPVGRHAGLSGG